MYDGSKWKAKVKGLVKAINAKGYKFAFFMKNDLTVAVMTKGDTRREFDAKIFTRGVAKYNGNSDIFCPTVGRYFSLKRAFEAALRRKNNEPVLIEEALRSALGKYVYKSQYKVKLSGIEYKTLKKKFEPRKPVQA